MNQNPNQPPAVRYMLIVAEPTAPSAEVLALFVANGISVLKLHELQGEPRNQIRQARTALAGFPLVALLDVQAADEAKLKPHDLAAAAIAELKPTVVRLTRADRVEQAVRHWRLLNPEAAYSYAGVKPHYIHFRDLQSAVAKHLPRGHMEIAVSELAKTWSGHVTNFGTGLGLRFRAGKAPAAERTDPDLTAAVDQFREDLGRSGKPKPQTTVRTQASFQRASRSLEDTKREVVVNPTAPTKHAVRRTVAAPAAKKPITAGAGGRTEPMSMSGDRAKSVGGMPMSGDRPRVQAGTPAAEKAQGHKKPGEKGIQSTVPAMKIRPFPGVPANQQPLVNPMTRAGRAAKNAGTAAPASKPTTRGTAVAALLDATPTPTTNKMVKRGYWEDRKNFRYYAEVVKLGKRLCPAPTNVLDVGGRDCRYALDFGANLVTQVDPDTSMGDEPTVQWFQEDFMDWQPDRQYDLVLCLQVLEHVDKPQAFLQKLLSCGQVVIVSLPFNWPHTHEHKHNQIKPENVRAWAGMNEREFQIVEEPGKNSATSKRMVFVYVMPTVPVAKSKAMAVPVPTPAPEVTELEPEHEADVEAPEQPAEMEEAEAEPVMASSALLPAGSKPTNPSKPSKLNSPKKPKER